MLRVCATTRARPQNNVSKASPSICLPMYHSEKFYVRGQDAECANKTRGLLKVRKVIQVHQIRTTMNCRRKFICYLINDVQRPNPSFGEGVINKAFTFAQLTEK